MERLNWKGHLLVAVLAALSTDLLRELLPLAGVQNIVLKAMICTVAFMAFLFGFLRFLRGGWFRWTLHHE